MPIISALGRLRQEGHQFKVSLNYKVRPALKKKKNPTTTTTERGREGHPTHSTKGTAEFQGIDLHSCSLPL
jgi:hypothetical protein